MGGWREGGDGGGLGASGRFFSFSLISFFYSYCALSNELFSFFFFKIWIEN